MSSEQVEEVKVPDLGGASDVEVIEILVSEGSDIEVESTLITLESDKATIEVPSPVAGTVKSLKISIGDKLSEGDPILLVALAGGGASSDEGPKEESKQSEEPRKEESLVEKSPEAKQDAETKRSEEIRPPSASGAPKEEAEKLSVPVAQDADDDPVDSNLSKQVHAGPAVRRLANELGVDLTKVNGSGPKGRILKEDVHAFVKQTLQSRPSSSGSAAAPAVAALPEIDFSRWGDIEKVPLTKIQRSSAANLHRSWLTIPHVTQFDEADITELNAFRKSESEVLKREGVKLTPLAFIMKAAAHALLKFPKFKSSLASDGEALIHKNYCHIGFAVETPNGLVVPVMRNVDQLSVVEIAVELQRLSEKARDKKLTPQDMQGGCFTISSLGGIGGTQFTPIVNWPEVAILGVSKAKETPVFSSGEWIPRLMLPVSLSYDHRVIDGADAVRFTTYLTQLLSDIRRILL